jgi:hypothetical protein
MTMGDEEVSAEDVAAFAYAMAGELRDLAGRAGLQALAWRLDETRQTANAALRALHPPPPEKAAPEDAA